MRRRRAIAVVEQGVGKHVAKATAAGLQRSAIVLAMVAGSAQLVESFLIAAGRVPWPGGARDTAGAAIVAAIGIIGAVAAVAAMRRAGVWAVVTAAGVVSVVFDVGAPNLALRTVPGLLLLLSAALGIAATAKADREPIRAGVWRWTAWGCLTVHALLLVPLLTLGLVVPMAAVLILIALWFVGLGLALRALPDHPWRVPAVPTVFAVAAVSFIKAGEALFGWGP